MQKMSDLYTFVSCNSGFIFQLTYKSHFYLPEHYVEWKFSLKERHYHKGKFYLE